MHTGRRHATKYRSGALRCPIYYLGWPGLIVPRRAAPRRAVPCRAILASLALLTFINYHNAYALLTSRNAVVSIGRLLDHPSTANPTPSTTFYSANIPIL